MKKINEFKLVEVDSSERVDFRSALDKQNFIDTHKTGTYCIFGNFAEVYLYIVVDTSANGLVLNHVALPYDQCLDLIEHYK